MVSKNKANFIISLQKKKIRDSEKLFVIEGDKLVNEFLDAGVKVKILVARPEFLSSLPEQKIKKAFEVIEASYEDLKKISSLKTPNNALAVIPMPGLKTITNEPGEEITVALDCVQDPGNLGTIIRAAAWFGIKNIYCSVDCADVYNSKVIQASMGAILYVQVHYTDIRSLLEKASGNKIKIYGTLLEGESIYSKRLENKGIILFGNESRGISEELQPFITDRIKIPGLNYARPGIDSLNVSMAASIIFSEFTRSQL